MAAYFGQSIGRVSSGGDGRLENISLPNGVCSFRDLNAGATAPTCGCRRFWLNAGHSATGKSDDRAWCFCGHHACFHDVVSAQLLPNTQPLGHGVDLSAGPQHPTAQQEPFVAPTWSELLREPLDSGVQAEHSENIARSTTGLGITNPPQQEEQSINTRLWAALNGFARRQDGSAGESSNLPSTAVPSVVDGPTAAGPPHAPQYISNGARPMAPPEQVPNNRFVITQADQLSATEVATEAATPSVRGTPEFRATTALQSAARISTPPNLHRMLPAAQKVAQNSLVRQNTAPASVSSQPRPPLPRPVSAGPSLSIQEMCNTIQDYGRRISFLESVSFNNIPSQEVHEQFEHMDGRLLDLEHWRTEQDKMQEADDTEERLNAAGERLNELEAWREEQEGSDIRTVSDSPEPSSSKRKRLLPDTSSFESDGSFDLNAAAQTETVVLATIAANAETGPRISRLESRITDLENAALPSYDRPWNVQVVLLPFGRQLPGVWFTSSESTEVSMRAGTQLTEEWTASQEGPKLSFKYGTTSAAWTTESIEAWANDTQDEWLSPKACGPSGRVFQRLASRGLVQDVEIQAPDAGHIFSTISDAFASMLIGQQPTSSELAQKYHGLKERFLPLRKVRKSSRLRFLRPAEMLTPALWTAQFLDSSIFMKANGERRLYLTTPEGYIQPPQPGWTWPNLKVLPMYDTDGEVQNAQAVGQVVEACWTYNDRLDHATSPRSSFASDKSSSIWGDSSIRPEPVDENVPDHPMASPVLERGYHLRSVSLPESVSAQNTEGENLSKRREASFEAGLSPSGQDRMAEYVAKRRRISTSPEMDRRGLGSIFTPRYSREPASPFPSDDVGNLRSSQAASGRARGTTPFAYPTPHSHFDSRGPDGDATETYDFPMVPSEDGDDPEEEWEGMPDAPTTSPVGSEVGGRNKAVVNDDEMDGEDLVGDLAIYER